MITTAQQLAVQAAYCQDIDVTLDITNVPELVSEDGPGKFFTCASDIGLRAGQWPRMIKTTLGNGMPFVCQRVESRDGDVLFFWYYQANGCIELTIFND